MLCYITVTRRLMLDILFSSTRHFYFCDCKDDNRVWERSIYYWKQEKTKGYGVRATTMEEENAVTPTLCFAQVSLDRCSKHAWSDSKWPEKIQMRVIKLLSVNSIHLYKWKSKRMPATYLRCMLNNNLKMKTAGYSCRPQ